MMNRVSSAQQQQFFGSQGGGQPGREVRPRPPLARAQFRLQDIHVLRDARRVDDIVLGRLQPGEQSLLNFYYTGLSEKTSARLRETPALTVPLNIG